MGDHHVWRDVYHVPWKKLTLYVKLTIDDMGRLILSLEETVTMAYAKNVIQCPECGGNMVLESRMDPIEYKGHTKDVLLKGHWCQSCGEGILEGEALAQSERAYFALQAEVDHLPAPEDITAIRESLHLSQQKASELLGDDPVAFEKYESGSRQISQPMAHLLRLLSRVPRRLQELEHHEVLPALQ